MALTGLGFLQSSVTVSLMCLFMSKTPVSFQIFQVYFKLTPICCSFCGCLFYYIFSAYIFAASTITNKSIANTFTINASSVTDIVTANANINAVFSYCM